MPQFVPETSARNRALRVSCQPAGLETVRDEGARFLTARGSGRIAGISATYLNLASKPAFTQQ